MYVFRYEIPTQLSDGSSKVNKGPYICSWGDFDVESRNKLHKMISHHSRGEHPGMFTDFNSTLKKESEMVSDYFCSCPSLESLKSWFKGYNGPLKQIGFKIVRYEVSDAIMGKSGKQSFFHPKTIIKKEFVK